MFWGDEKKASNNKYVICLAKQNKMHFFNLKNPKETNEFVDSAKSQKL